MNQRIAEKPDFSVLAPRIPEPAQALVWQGLHGAARALAVAEAACQHQGATVVVMPDTLAVERFEQAVKFFLNHDSGVSISTYPDWEVLPYDSFSPYQDIISARLACLASLSGKARKIVIVSIASVLHRIAPQSFVTANSFQMRIGERLDPEALSASLIQSGYRRVSQVMEHGDFARRGALLDVFPMGAARPFRIELFDDEIESIRLFDPESQRTLETVEELRVLPAREFPLSDDAVARFRQQWRQRFPASANRSAIYTDVSNQLAPAGVEYYLPLFFEETCCLFDYLGEDALILIDEDLEEAAGEFLESAKDRYERYRHDVEKPLLPPEEVFFSYEDLTRYFRLHASVRMPGLAESANKQPTQKFATAIPKTLPVDARAREPLALFNKFLETSARRVLVVAESEGRRETLLELLATAGRRPVLVRGWKDFLDSDADLALTVAALEFGAEFESPGIAIICESQLFGERAKQQRRRRKRRTDPELLLRNLAELAPGDAVVHEEHGVGRFQGLVSLTVNEIEAEFIELRYADDDKLYVPVAAMHLLGRFSGPDAEHAPLNKLGSGQWAKARAKAAGKIRDVAAELLELQARRQARRGRRYHLDTDAYRSFSAAFPFEETPDQANAIEAVIDDLEKEVPMDRLICGDSGFGKTEVAMRAAFVTAMAGHQVAVLVPTTLLAQQHHQNFRDRFADWPLRIELLSRFRSGAEQSKTLEGMSSGQVDIVIGTHKLLQRDVKFDELGLVILDEEHRFGVRQKEQLKALRAQVNVLTMTATPIPRTLNMALAGIRDLSLIATPPSRRIPIRTFVQQWDPEGVREAMLREINRGGQVYFLHNEVSSIEEMTAKLEKLMPEARVRYAHGQMRESELERVMLDFYHRRFNVLVSSTIIETGIDIPSANTIIINRADKFGLAQLYQLRGRVGRSHHRAYAYLLVPDRKALKGDALKRLEAIESLTELGLGFTLASHDLEIRGAGELLGDEQSGHIQTIGYGLYMELLERAVKALREGRDTDLQGRSEDAVEMEFSLPALLPEDYVPDVQQRVMLYKRIADAPDPDSLRDVQEEIIDRFGPMPEPGKNIFRISLLKLQAVAIGIQRAEIGARGGRIHFRPDAKLDPGRLIRLIQNYDDWYRLDGPEKLRLRKELPDANERMEEMQWLIDYLKAQPGEG